MELLRLPFTIVSVPSGQGAENGHPFLSETDNKALIQSLRIMYDQSLFHSVNCKLDNNNTFFGGGSKNHPFIDSIHRVLKQTFYRVYHRRESS